MTIEYSNRFIKSLKKANKEVQGAVRLRLEVFLNDKFHPVLNNHALQGKYQGCRSINITGDWRAVFWEVSDEVVHFVELGTHSQLYK